MRGIDDRRGNDLWKKALQTLDPKDRPDADLIQAKRLDTLKAVLAAVEMKKQRCMRKRFRYKKRNGDVVILRDVFEKINSWVLKCMKICDSIVDTEPTKLAALPWACIKLLMGIMDNDFAIYGAMAEGVELISRLITRYEIIERLYLQREFSTKNDLVQALVTLYAAMLRYLATAIRYYSRNTAGKSLICSTRERLLTTLEYAWHLASFRHQKPACRRI
jgi:hypothetical protein